VARAGLVVGIALVAALGVTAQDEAASVAVRVEPDAARVGDPLELTLEVELPAGARLETEALGPRLGSFTVLEGRWETPQSDAPTTARRWSGRIAAYEVGELELPAFRLRYTAADGTGASVASEAVTLTIESVLDPGEGEEAALADLKAPAGLVADFRVLWIAGLVLAGMLLLALATWWLVHRYGRRFAGVAAPSDPFRRVAPDVWAYAELQKLLDERLAEQGEIDGFCTRLTWILKRYLGGRYRIDLLEHTTAEVPALLAAARVPEDSAGAAHRLLERCDGVKFARAAATAEQCRSEIEETYRIIDATRVSGAGEATPARGAA